MVTYMKLAFTNVSLRHKSACAIQKCLRCKSHHCQISIHLCFLMDLKQSNYYFLSPCILADCLKQRPDISIKRRLFLNDLTLF